MADLRQMKYVGCCASEATVTDSEIYMLHPQIREWQIKEPDGVKRLDRIFKFKNFAKVLEFTDKFGAIAEEENHHPLIITEYGRVTVD